MRNFYLTIAAATLVMASSTAAKVRTQQSPGSPVQIPHVPVPPLPPRLPATADVGDGYVFGTVVNVTATSQGLMVMMADGKIPHNCVEPAYNWMLIPNESTAMIALFLDYWKRGLQNFAIYTTMTAKGSYCAVWQVDPEDFPPHR